MKKKKSTMKLSGVSVFFFFFHKTGKYFKSDLVLVEIIVYESEGFFYFTLWVDLVRKDRPKKFRLAEKLNRVSRVLCHLLMKIISFTMAGASFSTNIFFTILSFSWKLGVLITTITVFFFYEYSIVKFWGAEELRREAYSVFRRFLLVFTLFRIQDGCITY